VWFGRSELRAACPAIVGVHLLVIDFGVEILVQLAPLVEQWVWLVNLRIAIADDPQQNFHEG